MSIVQSHAEVEYPESDGKPMGETDLHRLWMIRIHALLSHRYRGQRVYVSSDLLVYYAEGNPREFVVPDDFVVLDCDPRLRRVYKVWEEGKAPNAVFEVTSRSTKRADQVFKPQSYARIGVHEYFLYDPTSEYLKPPLQGFRLQGGTYERMEPNASGDLVSLQLGILLTLVDGQLAMVDQQTGATLCTETEEAESRAAAEAARAEKEGRARQAAEEEVRRLREQLRRQGDS